MPVKDKYKNFRSEVETAINSEAFKKLSPEAQQRFLDLANNALGYYNEQAKTNIAEKANADNTAMIGANPYGEAVAENTDWYLRPSMGALNQGMALGRGAVGLGAAVPSFLGFATRALTGDKYGQGLMETGRNMNQWAEENMPSMYQGSDWSIGSAVGHGAEALQGMSPSLLAFGGASALGKTVGSRLAAKEALGATASKYVGKYGAQLGAAALMGMQGVGSTSDAIEQSTGEFSPVSSATLAGASALMTTALFGCIVNGGATPKNAAAQVAEAIHKNTVGKLASKYGKDMLARGLKTGAAFVANDVGQKVVMNFGLSEKDRLGLKEIAQSSVSQFGEGALMGLIEGAMQAGEAYGKYKEFKQNGNATKYLFSDARARALGDTPFNTEEAVAKLKEARSSKEYTPTQKEYINDLLQKSEQINTVQKVVPEIYKDYIFNEETQSPARKANPEYARLEEARKGLPYDEPVKQEPKQEDEPKQIGLRREDNNNLSFENAVNRAIARNEIDNQRIDAEQNRQAQQRAYWQQRQAEANINNINNTANMLNNAWEAQEQARRSGEDLQYSIGQNANRAISPEILQNGLSNEAFSNSYDNIPNEAVLPIQMGNNTPGTFNIDTSNNNQKQFDNSPALMRSERNDMSPSLKQSNDSFVDKDSNMAMLTRNDERRNDSNIKGRNVARIDNAEPGTVENPRTTNNDKKIVSTVGRKTAQLNELFTTIKQSDVNQTQVDKDFQEAMALKRKRLQSPATLEKHKLEDGSYGWGNKRVFSKEKFAKQVADTLGFKDGEYTIEERPNELNEEDKKGGYVIVKKQAETKPVETKPQPQQVEKAEPKSKELTEQQKPEWAEQYLQKPRRLNNLKNGANYKNSYGNNEYLSFKILADKTGYGSNSFLIEGKTPDSIPEENILFKSVSFNQIFERIFGHERGKKTKSGIKLPFLNVKDSGVFLLANDNSGARLVFDNFNNIRTSNKSMILGEDTNPNASNLTAFNTTFISMVQRITGQPLELVDVSNNYGLFKVDDTHYAIITGIDVQQRETRTAEENARIEEKRKKEAEKARKEKEEKEALIKSYHGFLEGLTPMQQGKIISGLNKRIGYNGKEMTIKDAIDEWAKNDILVVKHVDSSWKNGKSEYIVGYYQDKSSNEFSYYPKASNKTTYDYATYVRGLKEDLTNGDVADESLINDFFAPKAEKTAKEFGVKPNLRGNRGGFVDPDFINKLVDLGVAWAKKFGSTAKKIAGGVKKVIGSAYNWLSQKGTQFKDFARYMHQKYGQPISKFIRGLYNDVKDLLTAQIKGSRSIIRSSRRGAVSFDLDKKYPGWREQTNDNGGHSTQIKGTVSTYKKIGEHLINNGYKNAKILDASSGLGEGTKALKTMGLNIEDVEPFPSKNRSFPPTYKSYDDIKGKYDVIISNAVLNVIPDDWRADVLHNMADKLTNGGKLFINVRDAKEVANGKQKIEIDSPSEILVTNNKGGYRAYQKGFTQPELEEWVKKELGSGYAVEKMTPKNCGLSSSTRGVVVTKTEKPQLTKKKSSMSLRGNRGGYIDPSAIDAFIDTWSKRIGKVAKKAIKTFKSVKGNISEWIRKMGSNLDKIPNEELADIIEELDIMNKSTLAGSRQKTSTTINNSTGVNVSASHLQDLTDIKKTVEYSAIWQRRGYRQGVKDGKNITKQHFKDIEEYRKALTEYVTSVLPPQNSVGILRSILKATTPAQFDAIDKRIEESADTFVRDHELKLFRKLMKETSNMHSIHMEDREALLNGLSEADINNLMNTNDFVNLGIRGIRRLSNNIAKTLKDMGVDGVEIPEIVEEAVKSFKNENKEPVSIEELQAINDCLIYLKQAQRTMVRQIVKHAKEQAIANSKQIISELPQNKSYDVNSRETNDVGIIKNYGFVQALDGRNLAYGMGNTAGKIFYDDLWRVKEVSKNGRVLKEGGQGVVNDWLAKGYRERDKLANEYGGDEAGKELSQKAFKVKTVNGYLYDISEGQKLTIAALATDSGIGVEKLAKSGFAIPKANSDTFFLSEKEITDIVNNLTPREKALIEGIKKYYNSEILPALNAVKERTTGTPLMQRADGSYFNSKRFKNGQRYIEDIGDDFITQYQNLNIPNPSALKHRTDVIAIPYTVDDITNCMTDYVRETANYIGYTEPVKHALMVLRAPDFKRNVINSMGQQYYNRLITKIDQMLGSNNAGREIKGLEENILKGIAALKLTPTSAVKQFGSYALAAQFIEPKYLLEGLIKGLTPKAFKEMLDNSSLGYLRGNDLGISLQIPSLETYKQQSEFAQKSNRLIKMAVGLSTMADRMVCSCIYQAAKAKAKAEGLSKEKQLNIFETTVNQSQNTADTVNATGFQEISRKSSHMAMMNMYKSQTQKMNNRLYEQVDKVHKAKTWKAKAVALGGLAALAVYIALNDSELVGTEAIRDKLLGRDKKVKDYVKSIVSSHIGNPYLSGFAEAGTSLVKSGVFDEKWKNTQSSNSLVGASDLAAITMLLPIKISRAIMSALTNREMADMPDEFKNWYNLVMSKEFEAGIEVGAKIPSWLYRYPLEALKNYKLIDTGESRTTKTKKTKSTKKRRR